ncbi:hypothetical protein [Stygiolobus azoricus]|uniref:Uncharacterized protein n=1 Tax=Stygiolobus azoricus TaxID=41675 RepID=A0A650CPF6_9CREN|nr:hypothetical protein [Stygiolobus azoricus]QGR19668.1 hypothetical protein D1868_06430 [Stygiolobus azoricus]
MFLPSDVILSLIFNEKVKIGQLKISISKPSVILSPYYVTKTLKEWDLIAHEVKVFKDEVLANSREDICKNEKVVVSQYDISKRLMDKKFVASCGVEFKPPYYFVPSNERLDIALEGAVTVLYKSEADRLKVNYIQTGLTIDFHVSLFKNFSNHEVKLYEGLKNIFQVKNNS